MSNDPNLHALTPEQDITAAQELVDDLGSFLQQSNIEGSKSAPYVDSIGIPSIGIGINLRTYGNVYFDVLGITDADEKRALTDDFNDTYSPNDTSTLIASLTSTMASYGEIGRAHV